jgi:hypothetical protein
MKRTILIIGTLVLLSYSVKHPLPQQAWNHFWTIPEESVQEQDGLGYSKTSYKETQTRSYVSPLYAFEDNLVKYKLERKPFGGAQGETEFDFTLK